MTAQDVEPELDYHALNAMLNLYDADGNIQFDADKQAARAYFLQHVNQNTVFFHSLKEKLDYLVEEVLGAEHGVGRSGRRDHDVGGLELLGQIVEPADVTAEAVGERAGPIGVAVGDEQRAHAP